MDKSVISASLGGFKLLLDLADHAMLGPNYLHFDQHVDVSDFFGSQLLKGDAFSYEDFFELLELVDEEVGMGEFIENVGKFVRSFKLNYVFLGFMDDPFQRSFFLLIGLILDTCSVGLARSHFQLIFEISDANHDEFLRILSIFFLLTE